MPLFTFSVLQHAPMTGFLPCIHFLTVEPFHPAGKLPKKGARGSFIKPHQVNNSQVSGSCWSQLNVQNPFFPNVSQAVRTAKETQPAEQPRRGYDLLSCQQVMQRAQGSSFHKLPTMLCQLSIIQLPCVIPALVSDPSPIFLFKTLANSLLNQAGLWWYHDFSLLFSNLGLCVISPQEKHHTLSVHKTSLDQLLGCHLVFPLASFWFFSWVANPEWQGPSLSCSTFSSWHLYSTRTQSINICWKSECINGMEGLRQRQKIIPKTAIPKTFSVTILMGRRLSELRAEQEPPTE